MAAISSTLLALCRAGDTLIMGNVLYGATEQDFARIKELQEYGSTMAKAAAMMTNTEVSMRLLGSAWPQHMNKTVAETMHANMELVGMPVWSEADQTLAKALQKELGNPRQEGLATKLGELQGHSQRMSALVAWHILARDSATMKKWSDAIAKLDEEIKKFDRRKVRRIVDRTRNKFNAAVAEVDDLDVHRRAVLGVSVWILLNRWIRNPRNLA